MGVRTPLTPLWVRQCYLMPDFRQRFPQIDSPRIGLSAYCPGSSVTYHRQLLIITFVY